MQKKRFNRILLLISVESIRLSNGWVLSCFYPYRRLLFGDELLHLLIDVVAGKSKFFVKHFVGCGESEASQAEDATVGADSHKAFEGAGEAGSEPKLLHVVRQYIFLITYRLAPEETFGRRTHHAHADTILAQQFGSVFERGDL